MPVGITHQMIGVYFADHPDVGQGSLTGVFGLVVFECECRRKEIGVRKVIGAVTGSIIRMFCRKYAWIKAISFSVTVLLVWYAVDFGYKALAIAPKLFPGCSSYRFS